MTQPMLAATCFDDSPAQPYARMARVLKYSAGRHCHDWCRLIEVAAPAPSSPRHEPSFEANVHKTVRWMAILNAARDGDEILFLDVDTVILRPLDDLWAIPFDLAYTVKDAAARYPFNTGVVAVRVSAAIREFFRQWLAETLRFLENPLLHQRWRRLYGGIHQAALGCLFEGGAANDLDARQLPCLEWNCEDSSWAQFDPARTRIVHIKSALRRAVLGFGPGFGPTMQTLVTAWRQLERAALAAEGVPDHASRRARA